MSIITENARLVYRSIVSRTLGKIESGKVKKLTRPARDCAALLSRRDARLADNKSYGRHTDVTISLSGDLPYIEHSSVERV